MSGHDLFIHFISAIYTILFLVLLNVFLAIISDKYLSALKESKASWENLVTRLLEKDRRAQRLLYFRKSNIVYRIISCIMCKCSKGDGRSAKFGKNALWKSKVNHLIIRIKVLGRDFIQDGGSIAETGGAHQSPDSPVVKSMPIMLQQVPKSLNQLIRKHNDDIQNVNSRLRTLVDGMMTKTLA